MGLNQSQLHKAIGMALLMVLTGSSVSVAAKLLTGTVPSQTIVAVQYTICLLLTLPGILRHGVASLATERFGLHLFRGIAGVLGFYLLYAALAHIPLVDASLLRQSAPLCVPLVCLAWLRQAVPRAHYIPLILGFIGIVIILRPQGMTLSLWHLLSFLSAVTLAISMVATFKLGQTEPGHRVLFYYFALSVLCIVPFSLGSLPDIPLWAWGVMIYIGVTIYLSLYLYNRVFTLAPTSLIAPMNYFAVPMSGLFGWLIWDHVPSWQFVGGTTLVVLAGCWVLVKR